MACQNIKPGDLGQPSIKWLGCGRVLFIGKRGELYLARRYSIYRSDDKGGTWQLDCFVPSSGWKPWVVRTRLVERLLRYNIQAFEMLADGTRIAIARDGIYRADPGQVRMSRVFRITRGSRPLNLAVDGSRVLFGEYGDLARCEVYIYISEDGGKTFNVGYRIPSGEVRHIHSVVFDPYRNHYWVLTGDSERQAAIGALSRDLKSLDWINRGSQKCRAVAAIIGEDDLVYGTDSDHERNYIVRMDKQSGCIEELIEVEGSSLYAASFGPIKLISTCVEQNPACPSHECSLYVSHDGDKWSRLFVHKKDRYSFKYFQLGTIVLPYSRSAEPLGMCSGQAIQNGDGLTYLLDWAVRN